MIFHRNVCFCVAIIDWLVALLIVLHFYVIRQVISFKMKLPPPPLWVIPKKYEIFSSNIEVPKGNLMNNIFSKIYSIMLRNDDSLIKSTIYFFIYLFVLKEYICLFASSKKWTRIVFLYGFTWYLGNSFDFFYTQPSGIGMTLHIQFFSSMQTFNIPLELHIWNNWVVTRNKWFMVPG